MQELIIEKEVLEGYRLSPQQQRLWTLQHAPHDGGAPAYRALCAVLIEGPLNPVALQEALQSVVARHEICRTSFRQRPELRLPLQVVNETGQPRWQSHDLQTCSPQEQERRIAQLFRQERHLAPDFAQDSLLRLTLLTLATQRHMLLINLPALCADARTLQNLLHELSLTYAADQQGRLMLDEATQYVQFSEWQHELLADDEAQAGEDYWHGQHRTAAPPPTLPCEGKPTAAQTFDPDVFAFEIERETLAGLQTLFDQHDADYPTGLLAGWLTLLYRLTAQPELTVGYVHDGRSDEELREVCGPFAKWLPLRAQFSEQLRFGDVVRQVRQTVSAADKWQDYFRPAADKSADTTDNFFAIGFEFEARPAPFVAGGLTYTIYQQAVCTEQFKLKLACVRRGQDLGLELHYDPALFHPDDVARLAAEFQTLLASIVARPPAAVMHLNIVSAAERAQLLFGFNQTQADYPAGACLHELFEAQVARTPAKIAVEFEAAQLTYAELNARANQLAHQLRALGVGPDVLVGVLMERSLEMAVALLAILKAGGAYLPLDVEYPPERVRFMLEDSCAPVVLTQTRWRHVLPDSHAQVLCLDDCRELVVQGQSENPVGAATADNLAYVIYTSGSTGRPKGAMVHHGGVVNCVRWMQATYRLDESDKFLLKTSLNFDPSVWELFWPLWVGATVRIVRPGGHLDNTHLVEQIQAHGITSIYFVPSMLRVFLDEPGVADCRSLRRVICGGEALPLATMARFFQLLTAELHHSYGPTETSIAATEWTCEPHTARRLVPMGYPLGNTQTYILDQTLSPVPIGVAGELYIGGVGLGRGYLNRAALTAERFIPHPFSTAPGARLYRTGDLVRFLADGSIEFAGRVDHQVKLRGFRIELGEIETALRQHPAVDDVVVVAREEGAGEKRLLAYIGAATERPPTTQELRGFLKEHLPDYMVPAGFVLLKALPLMHNGKVDRRQLPEPEEVRPEKGAHFVAPRTPVEEMLADIWTELLRIERVGVHDNFFELGGHSLLATQLVSRVRKTLQVELPLRTLFETPTIVGMAAAVQLLMQERPQRQPPPIVATPRETELPLSFAQQRLWFLDQLQPGSPFYNLFSAVRLEGELNLAALTESFNEIIRRHEALRTVFADVAGRPVQIIVPAQQLTLEPLDLRALAESERAAEAMRLATADVQRPFDLSRGPLMRLSLLQLGPQEHILLLCIHHIISDAWSSRVLIRELVTLYDSFAAGLPAPLAELSIQYADFARWQREWLQGDVLTAQLEYWRGQLAGAPAMLELPTDRPRPAVQSFRGARAARVFPKELTQAIQALSQRAGVTQFMTLLAAFKVLLSRYAGQDDIVVGTPIAGRSHVEIEELIGFFVNTLVLRTDLTGDPTFHQLLGRVREVALGAAAHQDVPFEKLVEELQPERDLSRAPLFQVMFAFQNVPKDVYELPHLTLSPVAADSGTAKFDLTMFFHPTEDGLLGILEYSTDLFDADTVKQMLAHYEVLLQGIAADPEQHLSRLPLLTAPERQQMLAQWNDTSAPYPHDACYHQLFEAQVARTPDAIAVRSDEEQLTYAELNRRANRLAHFLAAQGVGAESVVAVLDGRGVSLLTAMLAIFKVGGAYLPLEPRHPAHRHAQVLAQSRATLVLVGAELGPVIAQAVEQMPEAHALQVWQLGRAAEQATDAANLRPFSGPQNLAYVIYTSGSTGVPKGAMIEQRGMINHLFAKVRELELNAADIVAQTASQCFDISVWQFLSPLLVGAQVRIFNDEVAADPTGLLAALALEGVTVAETVPSMLRAVLAEIEKRLAAQSTGAAARGAEPLSALRWMIVTGEALGPELCRTWKQLTGERVRLLNAYGPTECSDDVTHYEVQQSPAEQVVRMPIGRAVNNTQLYILDRAMEPVPVGVSGELYVGGAGVGRGYLYDARRTCTSFVPDPFAIAGGARLYRTGDLCRYLPGGQIEFLGRIDDQVKVRGFRIELGEIEAALAQHPEVAEAAVMVREEGPDDKRLVAYIVAAEGLRAAAPEAAPASERLSQASLRDYLKQQLPEYMLPQAFVTLPTLPLTSNGKLDRRALPAPDYAQQVGAQTYQPPRTETEAGVAGIWTEVLGLERVGVEDNFFAVGGHSLLATQVVSRVRQHFQVELPLRTLFESPTVAALARVIEQMRGEQQARPATPAITARRRRGTDVNQLLAQVQGLTEVEARQSLHAKRNPQPDAS